MSTYSTPLPLSAPLDRPAWHATIAGLCASLVAIGLARFAYTPLIPPLIQAHWFSSADIVTLGAANFAGYLAGALLGRPMAATLSNRWALRLMMLIASAAFFACAYPLSVSWFFIWRLLSGLSGGAIMVLVATTILPHIPQAKRGFVGGMIFLGLGLGIAASGTLIPKLLQFGLWETWIGLGIISMVLTAISWFGWPTANPPVLATPSTDQHTAQTKRSLLILYGQYAVLALGLVPGMVFLVDYIARGLGRGAEIGATYWVLYGLGAIAGPMLCGLVADRIGYRPAYRIALAMLVVAGGTIGLTGNAIAIGIAAVLFGIVTPGVVPLMVGLINEILPNSHVEQRKAWSRSTSAFALFQALAGYGYAYLFNHSAENYAVIFITGAVAILIALLVDLALVRRTRP
jgi:MFS family permease